ncbi:MAG: putative K(+)-stimulated pyrophosphate-energized sodium pump [Turneriella sp.]|nr:putative K(+)-stimulated pyrophosphate-energized sodium pump [Turneriella sp.]
MKLGEWFVMYSAILITALCAVVFTIALCINQITKRLRKMAPSSIQQDTPLIFRKYLFRFCVVSFGTFLLVVLGTHYQNWAPSLFSSPGLIVVVVFSFIVFLVLVIFSEKLNRHIDARVDLLRKDSISRLFRHFLYTGSLMGLTVFSLAGVYVFIVLEDKKFSLDVSLLPIYAAALFLFWLRFRAALIARSSDYAFELIQRQESALPVIGALNPLWKLRLDFAAINRFVFSHLEFFVLSAASLLIASQIEASTRLAKVSGVNVTLVVFALSVFATIPALFMMRVRDKASPETFLWNIRIGSVAALSLQAVLVYFTLVIVFNLHIKYFWIIFMGSLTVFFLNVYSAAYVAENHKTARGLIAAAASSVSTVVHRGMAVGMRGSAIPALIVAGVMALVYITGIVEEKGEDKFLYGFYALSLALVSMLPLFIVSQASAAMMPLASSAISRLKMSGTKEEKRDLMDKFRSLRSVAIPSFVLNSKIMFSALVILIFLVYAQILSGAGQTSLFRYLTQMATLLLGGIASYFLSARVNELVLNLGPVLVRQTRQAFRENDYNLQDKPTDGVDGLWKIANSYITRKILPLFLGTMLLPALVCLVGGAHGLTGYLIGFGFLSFLNGNSWLTTGAAWSSARHAAEVDTYVTRRTAQFEALVQADMVGDSMHEAVAPILASAILVTVIASVLFTPATLLVHEKLRVFVLNFL